MRRLKEVMLLLIARDEPLGPEWLVRSVVKRRITSRAGRG